MGCDQPYQVLQGFPAKTCCDDLKIVFFFVVHAGRGGIFGVPVWFSFWFPNNLLCFSKESI